MKKIIAITFLVLFLGGIVFYLYYFRTQSTPVDNALRAVPSSASLIMEFRKPHKLWEKLSGTNIMWEEVKKTASELNEQLIFFDSIYNANAQVKEIFDRQSLIVSVHDSGNFLFLFAIPAAVSEELELANNIANSPKTEKNYDDAAIFTFTKTNFSYAIYRRIFMGSFNAMLVEDAVRQINSVDSVHEIFSTAGKTADCNVYVNHKHFPQFTSLFSKVAMPMNFAGWTAVDLQLKPNTAMLNGFTAADDTHFLNLFREQKPQTPEFIIPSNTAAFVHFGFSNFSAFFKQYQKTHEDEILRMNDSCDVRKKLFSWIENEIAFLVTDDMNVYAILKSNNIETARNELLSVAAPITDTSFEIHALPLRWRSMNFSYFTFIDDYAVFSNEVQALRNFIFSYQSEHTLNKSPQFREFSENLSSESNIFVYANISRSLKFFKQFNPEFIEQHSDLLRKFEAISIQITSGALFYNSIFLKYNPSYKQETSTLWETPLDTTISSKPVLAENHYTHVKEIFAQDDANTIYLISNTGKILWKRTIAGKIISRIHQIDALKNNKLQMLFNTGTEIFLIDRNGKDVKGFPVKLNATNGISVCDYEKNKNYRIVVAGADGKMHNFDQTGKTVDGWEFPKLKSKVKLPVQYFSLNGKDYLTAIDSAGNVYLTDRSGKPRMNVQGKINVSENNNFFIETGKDLNKTRIVATDSTGSIIRFYFGGNLENIRIENFSAKHFFVYADINNDKSPEYIFADNNKLSVYAQDQLRYTIFDYEFDSAINIEVFDFPANSKRIGVVEGNKILFFNQTGAPEIPLFGNTPFSIGNINNDSEIYLVTGNGSNIYTYLLK